MAGFLRAPRRVLRVSFLYSVCAEGKGGRGVGGESPLGGTGELSL